ncbi:MAG: HAD-IA family hydrolase [Luteolibacter sp.]
MLKGLIFDLDGTLVDSLLGIAASLNHALAEAGLPTHPLEAVRGFVGNGARILITRAAPKDADEALLDRLENSFKADYDVTWPDGTFPYDAITWLLETLQAKGNPLAVLSNKPHPFTSTIVTQVFPSIDFKVVLGQLPGIPHKPDPAGALEIANLFGLLPEECTVIGDSTMDLETARNAGMEAIAVTWGFHDRERLIAAGAEQLADNPAALLAMLD